MSKLCPALSIAFAQLLHPPVEKRTPCDEAPDEGFFASVRGCTLGQSHRPSSCREDLPLSAHRELVTDAERRFTLTLAEYAGTSWRGVVHVTRARAVTPGVFVSIEDPSADGAHATFERIPESGVLEFGDLLCPEPDGHAK